MRRSFGGNGGMGGGRGGAHGGGGGMLRTVQRVVRAGVGGAAQEPFSSHCSTTTTTTSSAKTNSSSSSSSAPTGRRHVYKPTTSNVLSLSSSSPFSSSFSLPISGASTLPTWPSCSSSPSGSEDFDWECVDGVEFERTQSFYDDFVFGSVPSKDEVQHAVSSLQQVLDPASSSQFIKDISAYNSDKDDITSPTGQTNRVSPIGTDLDWIEPSLQLCNNSRTLQPYGANRVYDAFHLLQTEPCIQTMVISLSSDKAVWDAVLNNEVVKELRESLTEAAHGGISENPDDNSDGSNSATNILSWIFNNTKATMMGMMEKIMELVNELFRPPVDEKTTTAGGGDLGPFEEKLRTSLLLSIVVLLIVVVDRAHRA